MLYGDRLNRSGRDVVALGDRFDPALRASRAAVPDRVIDQLFEFCAAGVDAGKTVRVIGSKDASI